MKSVESATKILVLYGDVPLIKKETLEKLIESADSGLSILTTVLNKPFGYGRVKKDIDGNALAIVEEKDSSEDEKAIKAKESAEQDLANKDATLDYAKASAQLAEAVARLKTIQKLRKNQ